MGILDIFKRKKVVLTTDQKLDKMWDLWADNKLDLPCAKLMKYESEVNNGGHSQYFFNIANGGDLAAEVEAVLSMLPEPLQENLKRGYDAFVAQEDIAADDNEDLFEKYDDIFYEHEQLIIDIIYEAAKSFQCNRLDNATTFESVACLASSQTTHAMKLHPGPYEKIQSREKTIELRLWDEKRQQIKIGDTIVFTNSATGETLSTSVVQLHRFENFQQLYNALPLLQCGYTHKDIGTAHPSDMERYYSLEKQKQYGVVGIELSLL